MGFFSYDSKFSQVLMRIAYGCHLNLLWLCCSLPIFTIGASTTALYAVTMKIAEGREGILTRQFFEAFRSNFRQATIIWLILLGIGAFLGVDVYILVHLRSAATGALAIFWTLLLAVTIAACVALTMELLFVFPLVARVENTTREMLKNAFLMATHYLNCTIAVAAIHFAMLVVIVRFFTPMIVLGEGICALASSYLLSPVIRANAYDPDGKDRDPRDGLVS